LGLLTQANSPERPRGERRTAAVRAGRAERHRAGAVLGQSARAGHVSEGQERAVAGGFDVLVTDAGRSIVTEVDGKAMPVSVEEYRARLAAKLIEEAHTLEEFRSIWIEPPTRDELLKMLVGAGYSPRVIRMVDDKEEYDLYDVLAELGWGLNPRTREDRALAFTYKNEDWLRGLPADAGNTIKAIAGQFGVEGTEGLENRHIFDTPEVAAAGGLNALTAAGEPKELLRETKVRMFAA